MSVKTNVTRPRGKTLMTPALSRTDRPAPAVAAPPRCRRRHASTPIPRSADRFPHSLMTASQATANREGPIEFVQVVFRTVCKDQSNVAAARDCLKGAGRTPWHSVLLFFSTAMLSHSRIGAPMLCITRAAISTGCTTSIIVSLAA